MKTLRESILSPEYDGMDLSIKTPLAKKIFNALKNIKLVNPHMRLSGSDFAKFEAPEAVGRVICQAIEKHAIHITAKQAEKCDFWIETNKGKPHGRLFWIEFNTKDETFAIHGREIRHFIGAGQNKGFNKVGQVWAPGPDNFSWHQADHYKLPDEEADMILSMLRVLTKT